MPSAVAHIASTVSDQEYALLVASLLRAGCDTRAGVVAKALGPACTGPQLLDTVARQLYLRPGERVRELDRARSAADHARAVRMDGLRLIPLWNAAYPDMLRMIPDPPPVLWVLGDEGVLSRSAVGVVGSREAAPVSLMVARRLARELVQAGLVVVSGLAKGVDGAAHAGALEAGPMGPLGPSRTVAVMGSGVDVVYPKRHIQLAGAVGAAGAVVSELPPGTQAFPRHFPLRNRIISGLSRAVVVVEASRKSGSLITARAALDQGRDVLAVPGNTLSGRHSGAHDLIKDGARLVETVEDVLEEIGWQRPVPPVRAQGADAPNHLSSGDLEATMAEGEDYSVDELARRAARPASDLLPEISRLELEGRVARLPGGRFMRMPGRQAG